MPSTAVAWAGEGRALVGQGQHVLLLDLPTGQVEARSQVFRAAVVHSLENIGEGERWVVRGGKSLAVIRVREEEVVVEVEETRDPRRRAYSQLDRGLSDTFLPPPAFS